MIKPRGWLVAVLLGVVAVIGLGLSPRPGRQLVVAVLALAAVIAIGSVVVDDARRRGRSGGRWLLACVFVAPIGIPLFVAVGIYDRLHGRSGIEGRWAREQRWYLSAALIIAAAGAIVALSSPHISTEHVAFPGGSGSYGGSCDAAISAAFGNTSFARDPGLPGETPAVISAFNAAANNANQRCAAASTRRVGVGVVCLGAAFLLAMLGASRPRERSANTTPALTKAA